MSGENWYSDLLSKLTSKGDIGAAGLGFGVGMILDVVLHLTGTVPLGMGGAAGAALALGAKNSIQAVSGSLSGKQTDKQLHIERDDVELAYRNLIDLLTERQQQHKISLLNRYYDLWRIKLFTDDEFKERMRALILDEINPAVQVKRVTGPNF